MFSKLKSWFMRSLFVSVVFIAMMITSLTHAQATIRVDGVNGTATPSGPNPGDSWTNAYLFLQDALDRAEVLSLPPNSLTVQVWVADGIYKPDENAANQNVGSRSASFELLNNVRIYGGFAGSVGGSGGETALNQRNPVVNQTWLVGDLAGDDEYPSDPFDPDFIDDNSHHIVFADHGITNSARLDGFFIRGGNPDGSSLSSGGGGMVVKWVSRPVILSFGRLSFATRLQQESAQSPAPRRRIRGVR